MSETINGKWITDKDNKKIAPKTFVGQVLSDDGSKNLNTILDEISASGSAENIDYDNDKSGLSSDNVQGAIDELAQRKSAGDAGDVTYDNSTSELEAENVQDAIDEIVANDVYLETMEDYDALPDTKYTDGKHYHIKKASGLHIINNSITSDTTTWSSSEIDKKFGVVNQGLNSIKNYDIADPTPVLIGKFGQYDLYRINFVRTDTQDGQITFTNVINGGNVTKMYGVAHYDNNKACVPLGQYNSASFYTTIGINANNNPYIIINTGNRVSRIYLYIEYYVTN